MYERILNKMQEPTIPEIYEYIGNKSICMLHAFEEIMNQRYDPKRKRTWNIRFENFNIRKTRRNILGENRTSGTHNLVYGL